MKRLSQSLAGIAAVVRKELYTYLVSPIAYAAAAVFLLINGLIFFLILSSGLGTEPNLRPLLPTMAFLLLLVIPVLTMRLIAEERGSGTIELLMTFPLTDAQVVIGKYLATMVVYILMLVPTLVYVAILKIYGNTEWGPLVTAYLGLLLLGGSFVAAGLFSSSLARNQLVAGVIGIGLLLLSWLFSAASGVFGPRLADLLTYLSLNAHFENFGQGVIDLKDVVFYLSFIAGALFLTVRVLESSRWRA